MNDWYADIFAAILDRAAPRLLLLPGAAGWELPRVRLEGRHWLPNIAPLLAAIERSYGLDSIALRYVYAQTDREAHRTETIYLLEQRSPAWTPPPGGTWFDRAALEQLPLAIPEQRERLLLCLEQEAGGPIPPLRRPWARPGWFAAAAAWMREQLDARGYTLTGPIEQIKSAGISSILRVPTSDGMIYFKVAADLPLFANEPALLTALAARYPEHIPAPLAVEPEQRWVLLADFGVELRAQPNPAEWAAALELYSRLQRDTAADVETLLASGCLDRRLDRLAAQIDPLLADSEALAGLTEAELARLRSLAPRLKAMCAELAGYSIPPTLVHGDLHGGNIALRDGRYTFFDWTDSCIAHPFFDLVTMLQEAEEWADSPAVCDELRDRYLALWAEQEPLDRVRAAWALAEPLGVLHQTVSYWQLVANVERAAWNEFGAVVPYWVRRMLTLVARLDGDGADEEIMS